MKRFKTVFAQSLQRAFAKARLLEKSQGRFVEISDVEEYLNNLRQGRRKFIVNAAKAGAGIYLGGQLFSACGRSKTLQAATARVAIIGGGIAGLNAANTLKKAGITSSIYEASGRPGGRIFTINDQMGPKLSTELGGEFIDSSHQDMLDLVKEFGLELYDFQTAQDQGLKGDAFFIDGSLRSEADIIEVFRSIVPSIEKDAALITDEIGFDAATPEEKNLDNMSIEEYLNKFELPAWFKQLINMAYTSEMGLETGNQSALNFITFISTETDTFKIFGDSDERYGIKGGNQQLINRMSQQLGEGIIKYGHSLEAIIPKGSAYGLQFSNGTEAVADFVILALPFTTLRDVALRIEMPAHKIKAINELSYGTNSKLLLGFSDRIWQKQGYSGYLFNDLIQNGWENSLLQNGNEGPGGYTVFLGGEAGLNLSVSDSDKYLSELNKAFPGAIKSYNQIKSTFNWPSYGFAKGSYAAYSVGQWTSISGAEVEPVGNIFFAGEHCSWDFQGYMNGGAETGRKAAQEILQVLDVKPVG